MAPATRNLLQGGLLRLAGIALIMVAAVAFARLGTLVQPGQPQEPSPAQLGLATIGFLASSAGAALTLLGRGILLRVEISGRWARHSAPPRRDPDGEKIRNARHGGAGYPAAPRSGAEHLGEPVLPLPG